MASINEAPKSTTSVTGPYRWSTSAAITRTIGDIDKVEERLRAQSAGTAIHYLERDCVVSAGIRLLGCALWTDYELPTGPNADRSIAMRVAAIELNDHRAIKRGGRQRFMPLQALNEHHLARTWLTKRLDLPWAGPTVVVTHHGVHPHLVHPRFATDA
jgi:hypothetical protein